MDRRSSYETDEHYTTFIVSDPGIPGNRHNTELYLTYAGLMRVLDVSRSGVGFKFRRWIDEVVFAAAWGTQEQKVSTFKRVLNVDAEHLRCIMGKCPTNISCLYLIDVGRADEGRKVYKYGFSDNVQRRFKEHTRRYGDAARLVTFILIPVLDLSKAETKFKNSVSRYRFDADGDTELIALCDEGYINVKTIFRTISEKHTGNMATQIAYYESEMKDLRHAKELEVRELMSQLAIKDKDLELKDMVIELKEKENELLKVRLELMKR